jgi:hypothetical protein
LQETARTDILGAGGPSQGSIGGGIAAKLREALEAICELNHALLRPDDAAPRRARKHGD